MNVSEKQIRRLIREEIELALKASGRDLGYGEGEGRHTKSQLHKISIYAAKLDEMLADNDDLPEWVQSKVAVMAQNIGKIKHYLEYKLLRMSQK